MAALVSKQITVIVCFAVLDLLAAIAMGLRFYSMKVVHRKIKLHDVLCIVSLVMLIAYSIALLIGKSYLCFTISPLSGLTLTGTIAGGIGLHRLQVPIPTMETGLKVQSSSDLDRGATAGSY
jgi:hypothetical protein